MRRISCAASRSVRPWKTQVRRDPFDHPDWLFELKYDGFRSLAFVGGGGTKLVSRRGLTFRQFDDLSSGLSLELNADSAVLDGEVVKLDESGRPIFLDVIRRRGPFAFVAFDVPSQMSGRGEASAGGSPCGRRARSRRG